MKGEYCENVQGVTFITLTYTYLHAWHLGTLCHFVTLSPSLLSHTLCLCAVKRLTHPLPLCDVILKFCLVVKNVKWYIKWWWETTTEWLAHFFGVAFYPQISTAISVIQTLRGQGEEMLTLTFRGWKIFTFMSKQALINFSLKLTNFTSEINNFP